MNTSVYERVSFPYTHRLLKGWCKSMQVVKVGSSRRRTMYIVYTTALFLVVHLSLGVAELQCPQVGYVGSNAKLTCIGESDTHAYSKPAGSTASTCDVGRRKCIDTGDDKGEVINATHTTLTIPKVKPSDAGEWGCTVGRSDTRSMCTMAVANVPRCNISSYNNTDVLTLHEELTLTVDIQEYYCSAQYTFSLLYGNENAQLPISETVKKPTNKTANINVNITASALGGIRLLFGCHNTQQNVSCGGFKFTKVVPRCSITSDNTADTAGLHKNLSVDIQNYFCSSANSFTLLVGNVRQSLSPAEIGNKLTSVTVNTTLNIKESYSGPVKLIFQCQDQQDELACEGHLSIKVVPRRNITSDNTTDTAGLHKNLSVDIQNYFCSSANNFTLLVGNVRQSLSPAETGNILTSMTLNTTLNIKESYTGPVKLIFRCQNQQDELTCEGHLSIKANSANVLDTNWMGYIMIMQQVLLRLGI